MSAFDDIVDAFAAKLSAATAVCSHIYTDDVEPLPESNTQAIVVKLESADPQTPGLLHGNPVDWSTLVHVKCMARANASSPRPAANTLAAAAYARLAQTPDLGLAADVFIGEPALSWDYDQTGNRFASTTLAYSVQHRTSSQTLE